MIRLLLVKNMLIDLQTNKIKRDEEIKEFFHEPEIKEEEMEDNSQSPEFKEYLENSLLHWQAPEFVPSGWDKRWYLGATLILAVIVIYALISNSPVMAITFILIGLVGFIHLQKKPRILDFAINDEGIIAGNEIYEFKDVRSFWIFYEPHIQVLSLRMTGKIMPFVHIPIHEEDPVEIREILLQFIPEVRQEPSLVDNLERLLRI